MSSDVKYRVTVRGPLPPDIREKLAAVHAEAVKSQRRRQEPRQ